MPEKQMTANEGASLERQAWMAFVRREHNKEKKLGQFLADGSIMLRTDALLAFGKGRAKRNAEVPGSLGRKPAKKASDIRGILK